jgi:hypothetical protein
VVSPINPKSWVGGLKVFRAERTDWGGPWKCFVLVLLFWGSGIQP